MNASVGEEHYVIERLRERFATDSRLGELGLEVSLVAGIVVVRGEVGSEARRRAVAEIVAEVAPGAEIRNEVEVTEVAPASGSEEVLA